MIRKLIAVVVVGSAALILGSAEATAATRETAIQTINPCVHKPILPDWCMP